MRRRKLEPWSARDQWEVEVAGCGLGWHHSRWALAKGEIWVMYFTINTMLLGLGVGDAAERAGGSCIDLSITKDGPISESPALMKEGETGSG